MSPASAITVLLSSSAMCITSTVLAMHRTHSSAFQTGLVSIRKSPNVKSHSRRSTHLFLDPYEEQYRRYWAAATIDQTVEETQQQHEQPIKQEPEAQRQYRYMPGGTNQYLQYLSSRQSEVAGYNGADNCYAQVEEVTNPNPYESSQQQYQSTAEVEAANYDSQYQQYLEGLRQQMLPDQSTATEEPVTHMQSDQFSQASPENNDAPTTPQSPEEEAQHSQHIQDVEESFLRTLSNEVQYKKFLKQSPYSLTDINVPVLLQRFLDNIEDGQQKRNGKFKGSNKRLKKDSPREERKTVVVLGTGWASHAFIKLASTYDLRIVVVSPVNHFVFTPMLASAAVGTVEYRSMTEPIRVTNPYIDNYVEGALWLDLCVQILAFFLMSLGPFMCFITGRAIGVDVEGK